jgi:Tfp pilus assembly protein PilX
MLRRMWNDERGIALIMALGLMIVLGIVVTASVTYTTSNTRSSATNQVRVSARQLAEAGMNAAIGALAADPNNAAALPSQASARTITVPGGSATYWADAYTNSTWTIHAVGTIANPGGVGGNATAQLNATVPVNPSSLTQATPSSSTNPWAFMWAIRTGNACDETINTSVGVPLVVMGNLCLDAPSTTQTGIISGPLYVKAGSSAYALWNKKIYSKIANGAWTSGGGTAISGGAHLSGNQCKNSYNGATGTTVHGCVKSLSTAGDNVYSTADSSISGLGTITPVTADFDHYYTVGSPGPYHPCSSTLSTAPYPASSVFESETSNQTRNNSASTVYNLTPAGVKYDCVVGTSSHSGQSCTSSGSGAGGGQSYGEIIWDGTVSPSKLEIRGTVYIDGSVSISNTTLKTITYTCYASLYTTGTILMNNTYLCGKYSDPTCTNSTTLSGFQSLFSGWLPFAEWLFLVADGDGGANSVSSQGGLVPAGVGIKLINSRFQGGMYATKAIEFDANSNFEGPAIASNLIFDGNFASAWGTGWQSANCSWCSQMPAGTPGIAQDTNTVIQPPIYG